MQKPILRWCIGDVSELGIYCLKLSIKNMLRLYKDKFDYYICYNTISASKLQWTQQSEIQICLIDQREFIKELEISPKSSNPCWKLYPPRIDIDRHEIFVDNDLILYNSMPILNEFLQLNDLIFCTEALAKNYGAFNSLINYPWNLNTGFFGIPPKFDFKGKINSVLNSNIIEKWQDHLDEQGLVSYVFINNICRLNIIKLTDIYICYGQTAYKMGIYGQHFVGINRGHSKHWINFLKNRMI